MSALAEQVEQLREALDRLHTLEAPLDAAAAAVAASFAAGGKLLVAGNGGSAAEAQHLAAELVGRLRSDRERAALPAIALNTDSSTLTALGNDYGFDLVFARQVEAVGRSGDVLLVLSTSGASPNLVAAVDAADRLAITTIALVGAGPRRLHEQCTHVLAVPSSIVSVVQECHLVLVHALVELVEDELGAVDPGR